VREAEFWEAPPTRDQSGRCRAGWQEGTHLFHRAGVVQHEELLNLPSSVDRFLGAVVLNQVVALIWQWATIPFRSDAYAVLANALGCHNLYRTTWLTAKDGLGLINEEEQDELDRASARDRSVARWFAVVYVAGVLLMAWSFVEFGVPILITMGGWTIVNLGSLALNTVAFWESALVLAYLVAGVALPALLALWVRKAARAKAVVRT
jgi:hypothetical protein